MKKGEKGKKGHKQGCKNRGEHPQKIWGGERRIDPISGKGRKEKGTPNLFAEIEGGEHFPEGERGPRVEPLLLGGGGGRIRTFNLRKGKKNIASFVEGKRGGRFI